MEVIKTPFDIINILGKESYNNVANIDKKRHFFIINRMLSRALPEVAMKLSHIGCVPEIIVDYWNLTFKEFSKTTNGKNMLGIIRKVLYISMAGAAKKEKTKIDKDIANKYMELTKISKKEFDILLEFFEKELIKYLKDVEKILNTTK
jgi:hypothetical protein